MMQMRRFNLGAVGEADCPVFDGMFEYFQVCRGNRRGGRGEEEGDGRGWRRGARGAGWRRRLRF